MPAGGDDAPRTPTLATLRGAIPARCFERRLATSLAYLARSLAICAALFGAARACAALSGAAYVAASAAYALAQGTSLVGLWVIAHECGHHAFSEHAWLDDAVGFVLHSALLVPYFAWQASHARHHAHTGHLVLGETWVPPTRADVRLVAPLARYVGNRVYGALFLLVTLLVGWPMYLVCNFSGGRARVDGGRAPFWKPLGYDHFSPVSALFAPTPRTRARVALSTLGVLVAAYAAYAAWPSSLGLYLAPLVVANAWLVWYTMLHHTAPGVPHHGADAWTWITGALCTVDRDYGPLADWLHHRIGSTHVAHHVFPRIPHYHAAEATAALKRALGARYRHDARPIAHAAWEVATTCHFVDEVDGVQYYRAFSS